MPAKAHHRGAGAIARAHSRTSSTTSSRVNLASLQITQKDSAAPRPGDKHSKKAAHAHLEGNARALSRTGSNLRASREHIPPATLRRAPLHKNQKSSKGTKNFSISSTSPSAGDEDEWVSSESGAATPNEDTGSPTDEVPNIVYQATSHLMKEDISSTPRPRTPPMPRIETHRPTPPPAAAISRDYASKHTYPQFTQSPPTEVPINQPQPSSSVSKARSETHSPPRRSPDTKRHSVTRPPSTHSVASRADSLRPHPLIRAHSYGTGALAPSKPAPPLATVSMSSDTAPAQMSATSSPTSLRAVSPVLSIKTASASPVLSHASPVSSEAHKQLRRTSVSSNHSTVTLPVGPSASQVLSRNNHDRQRTISSSSTFAALSNFALRSSTSSPPRTVIRHLTVHLPPHNPEAIPQDAAHHLLPQPYLGAHMAVRIYRNPLAESYERVIKAKNAL